MRKARLIIASFSGVLLIAALCLIDYRNFIDRSNLGMILLAVSSVLNIAAMIGSDLTERRGHNPDI
jgi:tellurite resistance protein TehA-like permease